jgi:hypothetical protein
MSELKYKGKKIRKNVLGQNANLLDFTLVDTMSNVEKMLIIKYYSYQYERYIYAFSLVNMNYVLDINTVIRNAYNRGVRITFDEFKKFKSFDN